MTRRHCALHRCRATLRHLARNRDGVSGIEFAIIFPIIVLLFAATLDLGQALTVKRRLNQIATATSDIIAQETTWSGGELDTLMSGAAKILEPFDPTGLQIKASLVRPDPGGGISTVWSRVYPSGIAFTGDAVTVASSIAETGVDLMTVSVSYNVETAFTAFLATITGQSSYELSGTSLSRPRVSDTIKLTGS